MGLDIERVLNEKGLNKAKLAEMLGRGDNRSYVSNLLKNPTLKTLEAIANALDVDIKDLFNTTKKDKKTIQLIIDNKLHTFESVEELKAFANGQ